MAHPNNSDTIKIPVVWRHDPMATQVPMIWQTAWYQWWWLVCNGLPVWLIASDGELTVDRAMTYIRVELFDFSKHGTTWLSNAIFTPGIHDDYLHYGQIIEYRPAHTADEGLGRIVMRYPMRLPPTDFGEYPIAPYVPPNDGGVDAA